MKKFLFIVLIFSSACSNDVSKVNALIDNAELNTEIATDVEILYSDSAFVQVKIEAPKMIRHIGKTENLDEFPEGLHVIFYDEGGKEKSWMDAAYAIRKENDGKIYAEKDVVVYNSKKDKLRTEEIIWDESKKIIYTERAVKIMQPSVGDTIIGFGLVANQDFTKFEIKRKFSGIKKFENLAEKLNPNSSNRKSTNQGSRSQDLKKRIR